MTNDNIICYACDTNGKTEMIDPSTNENKIYKNLENTIKLKHASVEATFPKYILFKWLSDTFLCVYIFRNQLQNTPKQLNKWALDSTCIQSELHKETEFLKAFSSINIKFILL